MRDRATFRMSRNNHPFKGFKGLFIAFLRRSWSKDARAPFIPAEGDLLAGEHRTVPRQPVSHYLRTGLRTVLHALKPLDISRRFIGVKFTSNRGPPCHQGTGLFFPNDG